MAKRRRTLLAPAVGLAIVVAYLMIWVRIDSLHIGRSDFTATYMGATLLRDGHGSSMYDELLQKPLHDQLIAPDHEGNLPFVNAPLAAALAVPLSLLNLHLAYRLWALGQFLLLVLATALAIRAAPGWRSLRRDQLVAVAGVALACVGTWTLLIQGQWDGVSALGLAGAYAAFRARRQATAGAVLAVTSVIAKPHLALGLAAFVLAWRDRRLLVGALAGLGGAIFASLLIAGPGGLAGFVHAALHSTTRWDLSGMLSFIGIAGSFFGNSTTAHVLGTVGSVVAVGVAAVLGASMRRPSGRLEPALAGAAVLSYLASPHAYSHDLTLLVPAAAWSLTAAAARWPRGGFVPAAVPAAWIAVNVAALLAVATQSRTWPGQLAPWALIASAALATTVSLRRPPSARVEAPPAESLRAGVTAA